MKTFQPPIHQIDVDCGVQIDQVGENWNILVTFYRPHAGQIQFTLPEREATKGWHHPFGKRKWPPVFTMDDMIRVPRLSAAFLIRRAFELHVIDRLPDSLSLCR